MLNSKGLIKVIDLIVSNTKGLTDADKKDLITLKQQVSDNTHLNPRELEQIQINIKNIATKYYHDLDDLEKLIPQEKRRHRPQPPPRTAG